MIPPAVIEEWRSLTPERLETQAKRVMGEDEKWFILACTSCFGLFDVPKPRRKLPVRCSCCRGKCSCC